MSDLIKKFETIEYMLFELKREFERENNNLKEEISNKNNKIDMLEKEIKNKNDEINYLNGELYIKNNDIKDKNDKIENLKNEIDVKNSKIEELEKKWSNLNLEHNKILEDLKIEVLINNFRKEHQDIIRELNYDSSTNINLVYCILEDLFIRNRFNDKILELLKKEINVESLERLCLYILENVKIPNKDISILETEIGKIYDSSNEVSLNGGGYDSKVGKIVFRGYKLDGQTRFKSIIEVSVN